MDGGCVRLEQGDASRKTQYALTPETVVRGYEVNGATRIHVVDLDGAFQGVPKNLEVIKAIRAATTAEVEVGGGIRDMQTIEALLEAGINYVIIGTKALEDPAFLAEAMRLHGKHVIVGADARNGKLSTRGWTTSTDVNAVDYLRKLRDEAGVHTVIYTDIARDGMFTSPNVAELENVLALDGLSVIASGGVGKLEDIELLISVRNPRLLGVIVGKALYDGRLSLREAVRLTRGTPEER